MSEHTDFLTEIEPLTGPYEPCPDVALFASNLCLTVLMGPAGAGKSTIMDLSGLTVATSVVSRPPRSGDTTYRRYLDFTQQTDREEVYEKLRSGIYVQAGSHPETKQLYATEEEDFPTQVCLLALTAVEYQKMRAKSTFRTMHGVYVVPPDYETWQGRWLDRDGSSSDDYASRMSEGHSSLTTALGEADMHFIINDDRDEAADNLCTIAEGGELSPEQTLLGRHAAELLLTGIVNSGVLR